MRMQILSLVLLCPLVQLVSSQGAPPRVEEIRPELKECDKLYKCYVPEMCKKNVPLDSSKVSQIEHNEKIFSDCPGIIQIHLYAQHHAHVIIESLSDTTTSIAFTRLGTNPINGDVKATFACALEDGKLFGKHDINLIYNSKSEGAKPYTELMHYNPAVEKKIKCEINVQISKTYQIFSKTEDGADFFQFIIDAVPTTSDLFDTPKLPIPKCDPENIIYEDINIEDSEERKNKYTPVSYAPGKFECAEKNFVMEYRPHGAAKYLPSKRMECSKYKNNDDKNIIKFDVFGGSNNQLTPSSYDGNDDVNVRCVAKVNLFCDEGPKVSGSAGPHYKAPDRENADPNKRAGSLYCPTDAPHLVVNGIDKPIQNAKFECLAFGEEQFWTVSVSKAHTIRLAKEGPEISCTNILKCHLHLRIPESSVIGGDLDAKTFVPKCSEKGILFASQEEEGGKNVEIETPSCNLKTGKFEYKVKGGPIKVITETTKFECTYPLEKDENIHMSAQTTAQISALAVGIAVAICAGIIFLLIFFAAKKRNAVKQKQKQQEEREKAIGADVWIRYCMDDYEREAIEEKCKELEGEFKKLPEKTPPDICAEVYNWNQMLMNFQRIGMESLGAIKDMKTKKIPKADQTLLKPPSDAAADGYSKWLYAKKFMNPITRMVWKQIEKDNKSVDKSGDMQDLSKNHIENKEATMKAELGKKKVKRLRKKEMQVAPPRPSKPAAGK